MMDSKVSNRLFGMFAATNPHKLLPIPTGRLEWMKDCPCSTWMPWKPSDLPIGWAANCHPLINGTPPRVYTSRKMTNPLATRS